MITLEIDGKRVQAEAGQTILEAAQAAGIRIPTLCHLPGLSPRGSCRICLVEVTNWNGKLVPACATQVQEGMRVAANSPRLVELRRQVLELLFAERNHICAICVSNGHCELQDLAMELGVTHVRYPYLYPQAEVDASHPRFVLDHNRCVLCMRCVRVCAEVEGAHTWGVMGRGIDSRVVVDMEEPWGRSQTCTACGKCVQLCPTGALFEKGKGVAEMEKRRDFLPYLQAMREED